MPWFYLEDGRKAGPVSEVELAELFKSGKIAADASVQAEGETAWTRLDERMFRTVGGPAPQAKDLPPPANSRWTDTAPHPWRRYFARMIDNMIVGTAIWFLLMVVGYTLIPDQTEAFETLLQGRAGLLISAFVTMAAAIPGNALIIGLTGGSLGKWICGVKVVHLDGRPIGVPAAFGREFAVWLRGLGLGLPLISLLTLIGSYQGLESKRHTPWDPPSARVVVHRPPSLLQTIATTLAVLIWLGLNILGRMSATQG